MIFFHLIKIGTVVAKQQLPKTLILFVFLTAKNPEKNVHSIDGPGPSMGVSQTGLQSGSHHAVASANGMRRLLAPKPALRLVDLAMTSEKKMRRE